MAAVQRRSPTAERVEKADFVLVVCTETYERRFRGAEEPRPGTRRPGAEVYPAPKGFSTVMPL
jgi:hypothetical protein